MTLPDYATALKIVLDAVSPLPANIVPFEAGPGQVLAADVVADRDYPPFNRAQMDGYALRAADYAQDRAFPVAADVAAGAPAPASVPPGSCVKIATGAPAPDELDVVIEHEKSDRANPVRFTLDRVEAWRSIHRRGSDAKAGDVVLRAGTRLTPAHVGIAAMVGAASLGVHPRPKIALITSGDEVVPPNSSPKTHQIRNSNGPMLHIAFQRFGGIVNAVAHVGDNAASTSDALERMLTRDSSINLVVTVGGVSAGERDFFPDTLAKHHVEFVLRGAGIQPGRPVAVGVDRHGRAVLCLPGNPVSALVCAHLFGWPLVNRLSGDEAGLAWVEARLMEDVKPNPTREAFRPCRLVDGAVSVPRWAGSGDLMHTAGTAGIAQLPMQSEPIKAGSPVRFLRWA